MRRTVASKALAALLALLATFLAPAAHAAAKPRATVFELDNGMQVVVIPDHRAPVVVHMVWYKVGSADEERGRSGIAHFLEHLMFKGTERIPRDPARLIAENGGEDNAFTQEDATVYHQTIASDRLPLVMEIEADRMVNLRLTEEDVRTERDVVLEERASEVESDPAMILEEQVMAALFQNHAYGVPVIGWRHEVERLSRADALAFYERYYAPNNAVMVIAGDVEPAKARQLASETYGRLRANPGAMRAARASEPPQTTARRVVLRDARAGQARLMRYYLTTGYAVAAPREAEAVDLLVKILADGPTSRLYKSVIVEQKQAASLDGQYYSMLLDGGIVTLSAVAQADGDIGRMEAAIDAVIADVVHNGVTEAELERAKRAYLADLVYAADSLEALARIYGEGLTLGQSLADIEELPLRLRSVTIEDVKAAAARLLRPEASVTGLLIPAGPGDGG